MRERPQALGGKKKRRVEEKEETGGKGAAVRKKGRRWISAGEGARDGEREEKPTERCKREAEKEEDAKEIQT